MKRIFHPYAKLSSVGTFSRSLLSDQLSVNDLSVLGLSTWKRIKLPIEKYHVSTPLYRSSIDLFCVEKGKKKEESAQSRNHLYYHHSARNSSNILFSLFSETRFFARRMSSKYCIPRLTSRNFSSLRSPFFLHFVSLQCHLTLKRTSVRFSAWI